MNDKPDWETIRREYESGGTSLRQLAVKHNVSKTYLIEKRDKEHWNRPTDRPTTQDRPVGSGEICILRSVLPSPPNALEGANLGLDALVTYLKANRLGMDLSDHVKASNALSQYNKIIINALPDDEEEVQEEEEDLSGFNEDELRQYAEYQERAKKRA